VSKRSGAAGADGKGAPEEIYFKSTKVSRALLHICSGSGSMPAPALHQRPPQALVSNRNSLPGKVIKKLARRPMKAFQ
jgi:hypothetical protein